MLSFCLCSWHIQPYIHFIFKGLFVLFMRTYMHLCALMPCVYAHRAGVIGVCELHAVGAGSELRSTARAVHALNHRAIFPASLHLLKCINSRTLWTVSYQRIRNCTWNGQIPWCQWKLFYCLQSLGEGRLCAGCRTNEKMSFKKWLTKLNTKSEWLPTHWTHCH